MPPGEVTSGIALLLQQADAETLGVVARGVYHLLMRQIPLKQRESEDRDYLEDNGINSAAPLCVGDAVVPYCTIRITTLPSWDVKLYIMKPQAGGSKRSSV